ncbi:MAG: hypothetical protein Q9207_008286 [Kuettlingeria erythrocarpa]
MALLQGTDILMLYARLIFPPTLEDLPSSESSQGQVAGKEAAPDYSQQQSLASSATEGSHGEDWVTVDKPTAAAGSIGSSTAINRDLPALGANQEDKATADALPANSDAHQDGSPSSSPSQPALNETNGEPLESGKRRMTPTSMTPPPVPKKPKREPSPIRTPSPMDDEPVVPAPCTETKVKEHLAMGLEYPPPEYNLEGKYNRGDEGDGRRKYNKEARKLLPYQLMPSTSNYNNTKYSNSVHELLEYIQQEVSLLRQLSRSDGVDRSKQVNSLIAVSKFAQESAVLEDWDFSSKQIPLEERMEELLVKYGYDKLKQ